MYREKGNHIITAVTEHKAVLDTCKHLEKFGFRVTYLPVQKDGLVDLDDLKRAIDDKTILVTIMAANNEIGVLQPIAEIGKLCRERGVIFHTDAVQAIGKVPVDVNKMNIDVASITAHKLYGPKGAGALYVRRKNPRVQIVPLIDGGGHERGMRSGTLNVPGIAGLGNRTGRNAPGSNQNGWHARPLEKQHHEPTRRGLCQRLYGTPSTRQSEYQLRLCRR
jgi:cysteine desulfurase